jgi:hypothetical protein
LPEVRSIDWRALHGVPTALVTGTNGKTTVVRLLAACAKASGRTTGYCCTDGVFVAGQALGTATTRDPPARDAYCAMRASRPAVLETARGGILRRGLAVAGADVAVITSIAADHFGEYGVHDLETLIDVKLAVARALRADGLLVVNADDALLAGRAAGRGKPLGLFSQDADHRSSRSTAGSSARRPAYARAGSCCRGTARNTTSAQSTRCRLPRAGIHISTWRISRPRRSAPPDLASSPRPSPPCSHVSAPIRRTTRAGSCAMNSVDST